MTEDGEKRSAQAAEDPLTKSNSRLRGKREGDYGDSSTSPVADSAAAAIPQRHEADLEASCQTSGPGLAPNQPVKVPRMNRRGLFGRFTILAEVNEPTSYPRQTKWFITFVVSMAGVAAPLGSTIIFREGYLLLISMQPTNQLHMKRRFPKLLQSSRLPTRLPISPSRSLC